MSERWRDNLSNPFFTYHAWMKTVDDLEDQIAALVAALEWFANPENWSEEQLSNGYYFSAEWKLGFDPREIAKRALAKAESQS